MYREEWTERGEARALILRPDLGKSFLIFPDDRTYFESDAQAPARPERAGEASPRANSPAVAENGETGPEGAGRAATTRAGSNDLSPEYIDASFGNAVPPSRVETRELADQEVEGYVCAVTEQQAVFDDGRVEVTRSFRARELSGLAVRVEVESSGVKVVTERRDIHVQVPPDSFTVPADFRKVASPTRR